MKWCSRVLVTSPYHYGLCLSDKEFRKVVKKNGIEDHRPDESCLANADALCRFYTGDNGDKIAIVVLIKPFKDRPLTEIYGLIIHEATHIWQAIREEIGEDCPSAEFEAYSVQSIAQNLMEEFEIAMCKGKKCKKKKGKKK